MKTVILAGGLGSRLAEETESRPKPMVDVGDRPLLWHVMKIYSSFGFDDFFVALGYKGELIKQFFMDYATLGGSISVSLADGSVTPMGGKRESWTVHLLDTGHDSSTGGRVGRVREYLNGETFMLTYGDGVADIDLSAALEFHRAHGKLATITAVRPPARFGGILFRDDETVDFIEKPQIGEGWINGGFMIMESGVLDLISDDSTNLEAETLERLAESRELMAFRHEGFWQCVDTLRDLRYLRALWESGEAPWKVWS